MSSRPKIQIPDLTPMYEAVKSFVLEHQEPAGFLYTQTEWCDSLWVMVYEDYDYTYLEFEIKALRVKEGRLECLYDRPYLDWSKEAIANAPDEEWHDVKWDDYIYFIPTIFNIAENITEYVEE